MLLSYLLHVPAARLGAAYLHKVPLSPPGLRPSGLCALTVVTAPALLAESSLSAIRNQVQLKLAQAC